MNEQQAKALLKKYNDGSASAEERQQVETYFFRYLEKRDALPDEERLQLDQAEVRARLQAHIAQTSPLTVGHKRSWTRFVAAASVVLAVTAGGYFLLHKKQPAQKIAQNQQHDAAPGKNQAMLTLANGQRIILKSSLRGQIAQQGNVLVQAGSGKAITYLSTNIADSKVEYNTMSTAKGEMSPYPLVLADGTKVWLNAASSITFPTAFTGNNREVKITGEALFEVVHNASKPFRVNVNGQTVEDIGTTFDINAYTDEPSIKTTLLEGSAKVSINNSTKILIAGQQAQVKGSAISVSSDIDPEMAIAWKKGLFQYRNADIPTVMRQLARWYDVDIQYEGTIPDREFSGKIERNLNASQALDVLRFTKVHFRIEGKKIIVTP